jgi:hypothetical protein
MYREHLASHLRFLAKHRGVCEAEKARRWLVRALRLRARLARDEGKRPYRESAEWFSSAEAQTLLKRSSESGR